MLTFVEILNRTKSEKTLLPVHIWHRPFTICQRSSRYDLITCFRILLRSLLFSLLFKPKVSSGFMFILILCQGVVINLYLILWPFRGWWGCFNSTQTTSTSASACILPSLNHIPICDIDIKYSKHNQYSTINNYLRLEKEKSKTKERKKHNVKTRIMEICSTGKTWQYGLQFEDRASSREIVLTMGVLCFSKVFS